MTTAQLDALIEVVGWADEMIEHVIPPEHQERVEYLKPSLKIVWDLIDKEIREEKISLAN